MRAGVASRVEAARVLMRVLDEGGYSNVLLAAPTTLSPEDTAHRTAVVYGVLRQLNWIDATLEALGRREVGSLDQAVRAILRIGIYELAIKGGAPYAVVDTCVEATKALEAGRAAGLVNAILRKVARADVAAPAAGAGIPGWVRRRLAASLGEEGADAFLAASDAPARIGVRYRSGAGRGELGIPGAAYVDSVRELEAASYDIIDPASTAVALAVGAEPGMRILDIGAAPGGKTAALCDATGGDGLVVGLDVHARRLVRTRARLRRMGVGAALVVADGRKPPFAAGSFDRVLVDAPCTGLGTLRRRPEIRHRLEPSSPEELADLQKGLLDAALTLVAPAGRVVYSVCTVFSEETIDVVAGRGAEVPQDLPGVPWGDGLLLAPHLTGTDGMFIAVIEA